MAKFTKILSYTDSFSEPKVLNATVRGATNIDISAIADVEGDIYTLWMGKTGRRKNIPDNSRWKSGLNTFVMREAEKDMDVTIQEGGLFQSLEIPEMYAIVNGFIEGENAGISCYVKSSRDGWNDGHIPAAVYMSAQWCMGVTDCDKWYLAVLFAEAELVVHEVDRDDEDIEAMLKNAKEFVNIFVKKDKLPTEITGSEPCSEAIKDKYLQSDPTEKLMIIEEGEYDILCDDIVKLRAEITKMKEQLELMLNKLKMKMEFNEHAGTATYKITWKSISRKLFDAERFKKDYPAVFDRYTYIDYRRPMIIKRYSTNPYSVRARERNRRKLNEVVRDKKLSE